MAPFRLLTPVEALRLILAKVDYTKGNCGIAEPVGEVLSREVLEACHEALLPRETP